MVNKKNFSDVTTLVIDNLEGGYYNPAWHSSGDSRYSSSGETMFGIDRLRGGNLNTSQAGVEFWSIIDKNKSPNVWKWGYIPKDLAPKLKSLVVDIMYPHYNRLADAYLSDKAKKIVENDSRLLFHFIYSAWNGEGWFKKFANDVNKAVESGVTNPNKLSEIAIKSRTEEGLKKGSAPNSLIAQGGRKIADLFNKVLAKKKLITDNPIPTAIIVALLTLAIYSLVKTIKNKK